ncbi:MAG: exopolysaccharide Pel transporter PelG, partial [Clostridia bacterium]
GYAAMVCAGPMLLGFVLLLSIMLLAEWAGAGRTDRELMVSMVTYALLSSLVLTSLFSMLTTRYMADMIYEKKYTRIMPSFYGSLGIMLVIGAVGYGIFLHFAGIPLSYQIMSFMLFMTLIVVWTEINYLTAIKDYKNIMLAFATAVVASFLLGIIFIWLFHIPTVIALMSAICIGYGIMMVWYFVLIYRYFPEGFGTSVKFFEAFDQTPQLSFIGFFITLGLFGHLIIMWASRVGVQVQGLFYGAPMYDVAAIFAFFSILITTINFVTSAEVRFYPRYREYFSLFNDGGSIENIDEAEHNMVRVMSEELGYLAQKQLLSTLLFIILGTIILPQLPLGFTNEMLSVFRVLCVGYGFYAIGNSIMLISQYFADFKGAMIDASVFVVVSNLATILLMNGSSAFYGFGFVLGGALFCLVAWIRLCQYLNKLKYNILSKQPMLVVTHVGILTRIARALEPRAIRKQSRRNEVYFEKNEGESVNETAK